MTWSEGYRVHAGHRMLYNPGTGPTYAAHALRMAGYDPGPLDTCCEIGFGQGVALAVHQAAGSQWWGADFMPEQVAHARHLAPGAHLTDESIAQFCARTDLPEFDFVVIHGVWTWVSAANRAAVVDFLTRKLRPGGVLLLSYNTAAGWSSLLPLRDFLRRWIASCEPSGIGPVAAVERAVAAAQALFAAHSAYALHSPLAPAMLDRMADEGGTRIVQEWLGEHWELFHFRDLARSLEEAKLGFACQSGRLQQAPRLWLSAQQSRLLDAIGDPVMRESVQDLLTGQRHRRDYWVKGARRMGGAESALVRQAQRYVMVTPPEQVELSPDIPKAGRTMTRDATMPVLEALASGTPRALSEIERVAGRQGVEPPAVHDALMLLWDAGAVQPAQSDDRAEAARAGCAALNGRLLARAGQDTPVPFLANPVTGGAVAVSPLHQLFLQAERVGQGQPGRQAAYAAAALGQEAEPEAAAAFQTKLRGLLRAQGVA